MPFGGVQIVLHFLAVVRGKRSQKMLPSISALIDAGDDQGVPDAAYVFEIGFRYVVEVADLPNFIWKISSDHRLSACNAICVAFHQVPGDLEFTLSKQNASLSVLHDS